MERSAWHVARRFTIARGVQRTRMSTSVSTGCRGGQQGLRRIPRVGVACERTSRASTPVSWAPRASTAAGCDGSGSALTFLARGGIVADGERKSLTPSRVTRICLEPALASRPLHGGLAAPAAHLATLHNRRDGECDFSHRDHVEPAHRTSLPPTPDPGQAGTVSVPHLCLLSNSGIRIYSFH